MQKKLIWKIGKNQLFLESRFILLLINLFRHIQLECLTMFVLDNNFFLTYFIENYLCMYSDILYNQCILSPKKEMDEVFSKK